MTDQQEQRSLGASLGALQRDAEAYFDRAVTVLVKIPPHDGWEWEKRRDHYWGELPLPLQEEARKLVERLLVLAGHIANAVRSASLVSEADQRDVMMGTKAMRAALLLREFKSWPAEELNSDDGVVFGAKPAGQSDGKPSSPEIAKCIFANWVGRIADVLDLVAASRGLGSVGSEALSLAPARYRPGTAFIMMSMDKSRLEFVDVSDTIKQVFEQFDVRGVRADDIEHED